MSSSKARRSLRTSGRPSVLERTEAVEPRWPEVVLGVIDGFDPQGRPLVDFPGNKAGAPLVALSTSAYGAEAIGRQVALLFADADAGRPVIVGLVRPLDTAPRPRVAGIDGERLVLKAEQEIVLECGGASITLTKEGKVLIRGSYLSSRSSGVHRIKGASVDIN